MKQQVALLISLFSTTSTSFTLQPTFSAHRSLSSLCSSEEGAAEADAPSDVESDGVPTSSFQISDETTATTSTLMPITLRNELLSTARSLTEESPTGIFLTVPSAMEELSTAASRLEAITPSMTEDEKDLLVGDWVLLATSRKISNIDLPSKEIKLPFNLKSPPKLSDSIRNSVTVLQKIRTDRNSDSNDIDRVDHVIEYTPLTLSDLIPENSPLNAIRNFNLNPLEVSQSKVILVHNAEVESVEPTLRMKLGLQSVVLNVAGKSQYLDAEGADIFGLNIPSLKEFANGGSFDTTYVDENVRISRGTIGFLEELRVFVKAGFDVDETMNDDVIVVDEEEVAIEEDSTDVEEEVTEVIAEETETTIDDSVSAEDNAEKEEVVIEEEDEKDTTEEAKEDVDETMNDDVIVVDEDKVEIEEDSTDVEEEVTEVIAEETETTIDDSVSTEDNAEKEEDLIEEEDEKDTTEEAKEEDSEKKE